MTNIKKILLSIALIIFISLIGYLIYYLHSYLVLKSDKNQIELLSNIYTDLVTNLNDCNIKLDRSATMNFITKKDFSGEDSKLLTSILTTSNLIEEISTLKVMYNNKILTITITSTPVSDVINQETYTYKIFPKLNHIEYKKNN